MRKNAKNNKKGFTLIELIVVVAILVALMLMLVPRLTGFTDDAKKTANQANARAVYTAIKATETAKTTGLYTGEPTVDICKGAGGASVKVYKEFWEENDPKIPSIKEACEYNGTSVTYKTGSIVGEYRMPEPEASAGTN